MSYHWWCSGCGAPDDHGCTCPDPAPKLESDGLSFKVAILIAVIAFVLALSLQPAHSSNTHSTNPFHQVESK